METQTLAIGVVRDRDKILMRKKPAGSLPYQETWYLFGAYVQKGDDFELALVQAIKEQAGVDVRVTEKVGEDEEVKPDLDGVTKQFIYMDYLCEYLGGGLKSGGGEARFERLEWVPMSELTSYDIVPPSVKLFKKLGYLSGN